ncbi:MAG TPA: BrnA antitoxin family protein [Candidatus Saccharimonadales bacterium]|nr:BrnA antitoxin family protein [Candidatus Saccharimonadales bacterium]
MKKEYDFSKAKKNPYLQALKKQVTIRLDSETINYFKSMATENDIPYQTLINLYLRDCAKKNKRFDIKWFSKE